MKCPVTAGQLHEPLGELVVDAETEFDDEVVGHVVVLEEPDSSKDVKVLQGRLCVCRHCKLVYWEDS